MIWLNAIFLCKTYHLALSGVFGPLYKGVNYVFSKKYFHHNYKKNRLKNIEWALELFWIMSPPLLICVDRGDQTVLPKGGLHGSTMTSSLLTLWCTRIQLDKPVRLNRPDTKMELCVVMDFPLSRKHGLPRGMLIMR